MAEQMFNGAIDSALRYSRGALHVEGVSATSLAREFGTPLYVYSEDILRGQYLRLEKALQGLAREVIICYALKANANPTLGGILASMGAGADVVSGGEIYLAGRMGFPVERTVFAGVGKTQSEMAEALKTGVRSVHVESAAELDALAAVAYDMGRVAPVAIRVNPDIDAGTHPHITTGTRGDKFGVPPGEALALIRHAAQVASLRPVGLHAHVGSQLQKVQPVVSSAARLLAMWDLLSGEGIELRELDIGGGLGIPYRPGESPEGPEELALALGPLLAGRALDLVVEPGRFLVGPAGVLLTRVTFLKTAGAAHAAPASSDLHGEPQYEAAAERRTLVVVDAGMNDLLRPALYGAWHPVWPEREEDAGSGAEVDVVGPVCESSDVLARGRRLGLIRQGDLLAIGQAGAYGYSMASNYNGRPRPAEALVSGEGARLIRRRESYGDLWGSSPHGEPQAGPGD
ncbi:MAG: diaminopimelate decarboxylase [Chloroflexota bacterium]|nr:diaminopimelate decarboxylase [Chloroflexota bacterium]